MLYTQWKSQKIQSQWTSYPIIVLVYYQMVKKYLAEEQHYGAILQDDTIEMQTML